MAKKEIQKIVLLNGINSKNCPAKRNRNSKKEKKDLQPCCNKKIQQNLSQGYPLQLCMAKKP